MWAPVSLEISISSDSIHFTKVYAQNQFPVNGINAVHAKMPAVKAKYIRVTGINKGIIPDGEYGAGNKSLLMIDEIIIN